jgi:uncharacterized protein YjbI with pentapeptide repeats
MKAKLFFLLLLVPTFAYCANQTDLEKLMAMKKAHVNLHLDLSKTDLRAYPFIPGKIDLQGANLSHSNLSGVDLSKMNLGGADLSYTDLSNAKLNQVNFADANLDHANLAGAEMQQSDFSRANLNFANLADAKAFASIFTKANLHCANLNEANVSKSNFSEADISGATFVNTMTADVVGYETVIENKVVCSQ